MKICSKCKINKELDCFSKSKHRKDGHYPYCKLCESKRQENNKEKYSNLRRLYAIKNAEHLKIKKQEYFKLHRKEKSEYDMVYRKKNAQKIAEYKLIWGRKQRKNNPEYRIKINLRRRLSHVLQGSLKADKTFNLLGCDVKNLKEHLERQFCNGMAWDNYGSAWHIDHIIPCASFNLTDPEQQRKCFHYSNLQPLLKIDNLKKGRKLL